MGSVKYVEHCQLGELYQELRTYNIDIHLICSYMIIGNMQRHARDRGGVFDGALEFSTSDQFVAYCHAYLMLNFFLPESGEALFNIVPGLETEFIQSSMEHRDWLQKELSKYESKISKLRIPKETHEGICAHFFQRAPEVTA